MPLGGKITAAELTFDELVNADAITVYYELAPGLTLAYTQYRGKRIGVRINEVDITPALDAIEIVGEPHDWQDSLGDWLQQRPVIFRITLKLSDARKEGFEVRVDGA